MNETLQFELVSPEERLVSELVKMAVIPGSDGELGIGPNHASYVVSLATGVVILHTPDTRKPRKIFISGGFADITGEKCTVLAEEAVNVTDLKVADLKAEIENLRHDIKLAGDDIDRRRFEKKIIHAEAKLQAVKRK